jgi:hypothetical protein
MSVLLWWLPAVLILVIAWWRWRPRDSTVGSKDLRRLQRALEQRR